MRMECIFSVAVCILTTFNCSTAANDDGESSPAIPYVHIAPLSVCKNRVYVRVSVGGTTERLFILDNGCSHVFLDPRTYPLESSKQSADVQVRAMGIRTKAELHGSGELRLGSRQAGGVAVLRADVFRRLSQHTGRRVHGIIGYTFLRGQLVTIDLRRERICFMPRFDGASELLLQTGAIALPFGEPLLQHPNEHAFSVQVEINGRRIDAFLDLGFPGEILTTLPPNEFGLVKDFRQRKTELAILGTRGKGYVSRAATFRLGDKLFRGVEAILYSPSRELDLTIVGVKILRNFVLTFDVDGRCVYLIPRDGDFYSKCFSAVR